MLKILPVIFHSFLLASHALCERYNEAVKLARDPDVNNEELTRTFQRSYASARKVNG